MMSLRFMIWLDQECCSDTEETRNGLRGRLCAITTHCAFHSTWHCSATRSAATCLPRVFFFTCSATSRSEAPGFILITESLRADDEPHSMTGSGVNLHFKAEKATPFDQYGAFSNNAILSLILSSPVLALDSLRRPFHADGLSRISYR